MAAFMKIGDIKGEATDKNHKDWVLIESMLLPPGVKAELEGMKQPLQNIQKLLNTFIQDMQDME